MAWVRGLLCLLVGGMLLAGLWAFAQAKPSPEARGSSFWLTPVALSQVDLVPFGEGHHAWVVDVHGVSGVDHSGVLTHRPGTWMAPGFDNVMLLRTEVPGRAWVIANAVEGAASSARAQVYLVEAGQGEVRGRSVFEAERILRLLEQPFRSPYDFHPDTALAPDLEPHTRLWIVYRRAGAEFLATIDAEGHVETLLSLSALGEAVDDENLWTWRIVPVGKEPRAWLKTGERLFFVDMRARSPVSGPLLTFEGDAWIVPGPEGTRAWVMAETRSQSSPGSARRLYSVNGTAPPGTRPTLLLKGRMIRQVVAAAEGARVWVAMGLERQTGKGGGLQLVDLNGKPQETGEPLFPGMRCLVSVSRSGHVWVLTHLGDTYLLDGEGKILARGKRVLAPLIASQEGVFELITFPVSANDLLVQGRSVIHLRAEDAGVRAMPLLEGADLLWMAVQPDGEAVWLHSGRDESLRFVSLRQASDFQPHFVMMNAGGMVNVIPAAEEGYGWIQTYSASLAYVPREEVEARLMLRGGALKVRPGQRVAVEGRLDLRAPLRGDAAESVELDWPGRARAAEVGGSLEVTLWDDTRPEAPVASVIRGFAPGGPPPKLNWYLDAPSLGTRSYRVVFRYQDKLGTRSELEVHDVLFHAPLSQQVWFRTAVACFVATLLFLAPLLVLPRTRLARRWLPLFSWGVNILGGSGLALAGMARTWRIHFPAFVGVLFTEMVLCFVFGLVSPAVFRLLASTRPFHWLMPVALGLPFTRRRVLADYVAHVSRKLESWRRQSNDERYVSLPIDFREGETRAASEAPAPMSSPLPLRQPEERILRLLTHGGGGNVLIESSGGRGKSALLREVVRRMLERFEEDPSQPLPVLCDGRGRSLEEALFRALESNPLPRDIHEALLLRGDYVLVMDDLAESALSAEALGEFLDGRYGDCVRLLLSSRPHLGFRRLVEGSRHWLIAEPRRLDEETLERFVAAYAPEPSFGLERSLEACRGPDGTYLPILVRLALLSGGGPRDGIASLYEAAFRALLRRQGVAGGEDSELLAWVEDFCVRTYWADGIRTLRYRNAPERERMQKLLHAGVLVPDDPSVTSDHPPSQVRFFHDSMQSYLTARGLFAQEHSRDTWDFLWRAAADPRFSIAQSELVSGTGSELFQMCLQVFGPEEKLKRELRRQLLEWAYLYDNNLTKLDIVSAMPDRARPYLEALLHSGAELSPRSVLREAVSACSEDLPSLGLLYLRMAHLLWPLQPASVSSGDSEPSPSHVFH